MPPGVSKSAHAPSTLLHIKKKKIVSNVSKVFSIITLYIIFCLCLIHQFNIHSNLFQQAQHSMTHYCRPNNNDALFIELSF